MKPSPSKKQTLALFVAAASAALATTAPTALAQEPTGAMLEEVVVTGTRRSDRSVLESAVPIDIISEEMLTSTGITETNQLLNRLLPSFNFPLPSITDGTDHVRPATLRGLAPDHTLVLVNGKRRHASALLNLNGSVGRGSSAVDMNMIPANAIKRIEVLRDGAAAQYGSDAIAGVINVVLKDAPEGFSSSVIYGEYDTKMDGSPELSGVSIGPDGTLQLNEGGDRQVSDGETLTVRANGGIGLGEDGFLNISGEFRDRDPTNRSGYDPRNNYASLPDGSADPQELGFDRINHRFGNADVEDMALFYNAGLPLDGNWELYSFGSYGEREGESAGFYRRAQDSRNIPDIYPNGFLPLITSEITDYSAAVGVRGDWNGWAVDSSLLIGSNELEYNIRNTLNASFGPTSPTEFYAGTLTNEHLVFNAGASQLFDMGGMPVNVAFGIEYRDETYKIDAGEPGSYEDGGFEGKAAGSQVFPGFTPESEVEGDRDNISVYVDLDADVTARWNVAVAARYEDYSDFGSTVTGKFATRYEITENFALRGSVATGFRAPSLAQQYFTSVATVFVDAVPTETGTFRPDSDVARALGSPGLEEETSISYSAGFSWQPVDGLSVTVDYFHIEIDDRIVLSENLSGEGIEQLLAGTGANRARFFLNGIDSETSGFDIVANYDLDLGDWGRMALNGGYNYTDNEVTDVLAPPPELAAVGVTEDNLFARREVARFEDGGPEDKINLGATWYYNDLSVDLRMTRFGETIDPGLTAETDEKLDEQWITDLEVAYDITQNISLAVGANNLFDVYPDDTVSNDLAAGLVPSTFDRIFPYSGFSPFGFNGRFLYGRLAVQF
ncbi:TonB-dependent receptor plug domain-containing protein [Pseudohaliea rubra]|uniref:Ferric enterobactin receptor n=1 Tax=Pseudohaliea rubra DSM 19751 TaxID=1265313 RepID=A0A095VUE5_9GAMM|nr:TonB-dependent receptor [Pseudohaliea rubra]KGE04668.1 Ferric enterobactin receptor [Pseudohaliea rubra DSM 19751]